MRRIALFLFAFASIMPLFAEAFYKVTDHTTLQDGDLVLLAYEEGGIASAGFASSKKFISTVQTTVDADKILVEEPTPITLKKNGNAWNLYINDKPIGHNSNSSDLKENTTCAFDITITNGLAKVVSQTAGKNQKEVFFAYNTSSPRFALYHATSNMKDVALYRYDADNQPAKELKSVTLKEKELQLRAGETATLSVTLQPVDAADTSLTWGTTNASVATVADGMVSAVAEGTAQIWVKANAADLSDTCTITVIAPWNNTLVTYNALKSPEYLTDGAKVFFGTIKDGEDKVMGLFTSGNNIKGVAATYGDSRHTVSAEQSYAYTVLREGDYFIFQDQDGNYLRPISDSKLRNSTTLDNQAKWTISQINQDDATLEIKNLYFSSTCLYYNHQGTNDLFNIYSGYDANNLAKVILYASTAPEWVDRVREPWIQVSDTVLDWGRQEPDTAYASDLTYKDWGDARRFTITFNDLTEDINLTLTGDTSFYCGTTTIRKDAKNPVEITVYWATDEPGNYTAQLHIYTATEGVGDILIPLRAQAVAIGTGDDTEEETARFTTSTNTLSFNLNVQNNYSDLQAFTFSTSNLSKTLYCKWEHPGSILFQYAYENACMEILAGDYELLLNDAAHFEAGLDYHEEEVLVAVGNLFSAGDYTTKLHFYSYKKNSKEELAIDRYVTINIHVEDPMETAIKELPMVPEIDIRKLLYNGQFIILRGGRGYSIDGKEIN